MLKFAKKNWALLSYLLLSIFVVLPFFQNGFFPIHDDVQVTRVFEMSKSLSSGMFPVRWASDLGYGYGYPIFNFYSVLPYYIGGFLNILGLDALFATKMTFVIAILLSGVSMYLLVKEFFGKMPALVSSLIYLYFPYHAVNIYVRGDLAEIFAYALLPLVFLFLFKLHEGASDKRKKTTIAYVIACSIVISLIIISHNLSFFMLFIFLIFFFFFSLLFSRDRRIHLIKVYSSILILSFLLSAFYAIPAIVEMPYTNVLSQVGGGADYNDHFVCIGQLWDSTWGFGGSTKGCLDGLSFKLGKLNVVLGFLSLVSLIFIKEMFYKRKLIIILPFIFLFLSIFFTLENSKFFWNIVPFMDFLQFPWRFLNFVGLFLSFCIGIMAAVVYKNIGKQAANSFFLAIIFLTIFFNLKLFMPQQYLNLSNNLYTSEENIKNKFSKISDEYLPANFTPREALQGDKLIQKKEEIVQQQILHEKTSYLNMKINTEKETEIIINRTFFPSWRVFLNQKEVDYKNKEGKIALTMPSGENALELKLGQTKIEWIGNVLSLIGIIAIVIAIIPKSIINKLYAKKAS